MLFLTKFLFKIAKKRNESSFQPGKNEFITFLMRNLSTVMVSMNEPKQVIVDDFMTL